MSMTAMNDRIPVTRRRFCGSAGRVLTAIAFAGACHRKEPQEEPASPPATDGRIGARPRASTKTSSTTGPLGLSRERDAILQLPSQPIAVPLPLLVLLHGAGGSASGVLRRLGTAADEAGVAVLAPDSREQTWDALHGGIGPDVRFLDRALERVFDALSVDPARLSIGGFSDGATYAISLGLINGDLFSRVLAFSPGFFVEGTAHGRPRFYVSHGTADRILPIDRCSRRIVPRLQQRGYQVTFMEFEGGHEVPAAIAREGMRWAAGG
jgi:phospholipase/carboxylesterase